MKLNSDETHMSESLVSAKFTTGGVGASMPRHPACGGALVQAP